MKKLSLWVLAALAAASAAWADSAQDLPTGQKLTPTAAPGAIFRPLATELPSNPGYIADGAAAAALSPDMDTMLILTSGYNRVNAPDGSIAQDRSTQYILVYDVTHGSPRHKQTLTVANAFGGIVWRVDSKRFYVGGGVDDVVHEFARTKNGFAERGKPIKLGHKAGLGLDVKPQTAGVAIDYSGRRLLVANYYNDSLSLIDLRKRKVVAELDLRPGNGVPGGEFPFSVVWSRDNRAHVSAPRDREIIAIDVRGNKLRVAGRIRTIGEPTALVQIGHGLFAVEDNADRLAVIDTAAGRLLHEVRLGLPPALGANVTGKGLNPNAIGKVPNIPAILVTLGGINAVAMIDLAGTEPVVAGLMPTGWYPSAVAVGTDGRVYVANRKSPPGPNPKACGPNFAADRKAPRACSGENQYIYQLEKAGLLDFPMPDAPALAKLTLQVAANIGLDAQAERAKATETMAALRAKIKHVIFVIKENRTYDQVLGDLEIGNGDPALAILGEALTPNHHDLARNFVTFDNFYDSGEQSSTGWNWSTAARATDLMEKTAPVSYAGRGLAYEAEGGLRDVNVSLPQNERRKWHPALSPDPDLLPGDRHLTQPDGDGDDMEGQGYLWDGAIRAGLSVRNYGFANDFVYGDDPSAIPPVREPAKENRVVYVPSNKALASRSDPFFRGYDQKFPDYWRVQEWAREFDEQTAKHDVPALSLLRISHDHFGEFDKAIDGVNTVETQMADNDYALGLIVEKVAASNVADSTLVVAIEDDAQAGADHVDARRSFALIAGPYVREHALVSTRYTTINVLRTIEDILGIKPLGLNDALAAPMADAFDLDEDDWSFEARVPAALRKTQLPLPPAKSAEMDTAICPMRSASYWAKAMRGQNFALEDRLDTEAFNRALWTGLAGDDAAPPTRHGRDLRENRATLLAKPRRCD